MSVRTPRSAAATAIRPFHVEVPRGGAGRAAPSHRRDALARQGARRRSVAGCAAGDDPGARPLLGDGVRLARVRGEAERAATVHDRDRRRGHPLHPRKSRHEDALPLIMTHGWPGSVIELLEAVGPLTDPTAHGGAPRTRSTWCCRRCPATASPPSRPSSAGSPAAPRSAWAELMRRLGYTRYVAQGGDVGAAVTDAMGRQAPEGLIGIHTNLLVTGAGRRRPPGGDRGGTRGGRRARHIPDDRLRLLPRAGDAAPDDRLRPAGFTRRPGGLDARPRHRRLLQDLPRVRRRAARRATSPGTTSSTTSRSTG